MSGGTIAPTALGHVRREPPATPYTFTDRYTDSYVASTVVVDSGEGGGVCKCTLSRTPRNKYDVKSDMRSYAAYVILLYIAASS
jgi:hypothetical protein